MATRKKKEPTKPRNLARVKEAFWLHWPTSLKNPSDGDGTGRGGPGYIVDLDAPFEKEWCEGQMHKLCAIPLDEQEGVEASSIDDVPAARMARAKALGELKDSPKPEPVGAATARTAEANADAGADDPMDPELPMEPGGAS